MDFSYTPCPRKNTASPEHVWKSSIYSQICAKHNICTCLKTKFSILVKICAIVSEILTFDKWSSKVYRFQLSLACVPWSWLWRQHWLLTVPVRRLSRKVVVRWISCHRCNGLQTAMISTRWTLLSGSSCRRSASRPIARESVTSTTLSRLVEEWSRFEPRDHQFCTYSVVSSFVCVCERGRRTYEHFHKNYWWMITLLHWR